MVRKLPIELGECLLPNFPVPIVQQRDVAALGKRNLLTFIIGHHAEDHVDVGELRERVAMSSHRRRARRQDFFFSFR